MDTINNGVTEVDTTDLEHRFPDSRFWMLTRGSAAVQDVDAAEREEAAAAGVTEFDNFAFALTYHRVEDATAVAKRLARRFGEPFHVYGGRDRWW